MAIVLNSYRPNRRARFSVALWSSTFALGCVLYFATAQRTISWQDSGMFQWRSLTGDYSGFLGLALAHPLYIAAGQCLAAISRQHLPLLLNCFSGLGMAVALANLSAITFLLTRRKWIALLTAAMLAVTHTVWWLSSVAEVYTWSVAGLTGELLLLVLLLDRPRWSLLAWLGLLNGLGLCVHNFALLATPIYTATAIVLVVRGKLTVRSLVGFAVAWLIGAALYIGMTIDLAISGTGIVGAVHSALMGKYGRQVLNVGATGPRWKENIFLSGLNFVGLLLPLAVVGWTQMRRRLGAGTAAVLGAVTLVHVMFFVRYPVPDQFTFILPTLAMLAIAASVGMAALSDISPRWRTTVIAISMASLLWQPALYAVGPALARASGKQVSQKQPLGSRDELSYWMVPWKHNERSAETFAAAAFAQAMPDGVIVPHGTSRYPLLLHKMLMCKDTRVAVQFAGSPLPPYDADTHAFSEALGGRQLLLVVKSTESVSARLLADATISDTPNPVLYTVKLPKH